MKRRSNPQPTKSAVFLACAGCLGTFGVIDWVTGPEVSISVFYLIPGILAGWYSTKVAGIVFAITSSVVWLLVELHFGRNYRHEFAPYLNGALQLAMALFSSLVVTAVRDSERAVREESAGQKKAEMELNAERALAEAVEREQHRIGMDIHDGLGQHLVSAGFVASMLKTKLEEQGVAEAKEAGELGLLVQDAIGQSRRLARGLFPVKLEAEGLASALQELADTVSAHSGISCRFKCTGSEGTIDRAMSSHLYRIAQEAVNNASKHGEAKNIMIELNKEKGRVDLSIVNDGKRFQEGSNATKGMGLPIMEYRARIIGGNLQIGPGASDGTRVHVTAPVTDRRT